VKGLLHGHTDQAKDILITSDGSRTLSASWDLDAGQFLKTFKYNSGFHTVSWNSKHAQALSGASGGALVLWDLVAGEILAELMHPKGLVSVALGENGYGFSVGHDCSVILTNEGLVTVQSLQRTVLGRLCLAPKFSHSARRPLSLVVDKTTR
jgi:WD40 repeat protein